MTPAHRLFWRVYAALYDFIWDGPVTDAVNAEVMRAVPCVETVGVGPARAPAGELPLTDAASAFRRAVDLGCGTGLSASPLLARGWEVVGVDRVPSMLSRARARGRITAAVEASAASTGLPAGSFAVVLVENVLQVAVDPVAILAEALRLVVPGGLVICTWPADGLDLSTLHHADLAAGRPWAHAALAAGARLIMGLMGLPLGVRAWSGDEVSQAVEEWCGEAGCRVMIAGCACGISSFAVIHAG